MNVASFHEWQHLAANESALGWSQSGIICILKSGPRPAVLSSCLRIEHWQCLQAARVLDLAWSVFVGSFPSVDKLTLTVAFLEAWEVISKQTTLCVEGVFSASREQFVITCIKGVKMCGVVLC